MLSGVFILGFVFVFGEKTRTFAIPNGGTVDTKRRGFGAGKKDLKIFFAFTENLLTFADPNGKAGGGRKKRKNKQGGNACGKEKKVLPLPPASLEGECRETRTDGPQGRQRAPPCSLKYCRKIIRRKIPATGRVSAQRDGTRNG